MQPFMLTEVVPTIDYEEENSDDLETMNIDPSL